MKKITLALLYVLTFASCTQRDKISEAPKGSEQTKLTQLEIHTEKFAPILKVRDSFNNQIFVRGSKCDVLAKAASDPKNSLEYRRSKLNKGYSLLNEMVELKRIVDSINNSYWDNYPASASNLTN